MSDRPSVSRYLAKLTIAVLVLAGAFTAYGMFGDALTLEYFAEREADLRDVQDRHPRLTAVGGLVLYTVLAGLSLPVTVLLSIAFGWYYGFWLGLLLVSFGSTAGATVTFLISRYLFRDWVRRAAGSRLDRFHEAFRRDGVFYLISLRLLPGVPFILVNASMALTEIRTRTFWWASQAAMLPGTIVYVYTGSVVPKVRTLADEGIRGLITTPLILAFVLFAILPLLIKKTLDRLRRSSAEV